MQHPTSDVAVPGIDMPNTYRHRDADVTADPAGGRLSQPAESAAQRVYVGSLDNLLARVKAQRLILTGQVTDSGLLRDPELGNAALTMMHKNMPRREVPGLRFVPGHIFGRVTS